MASRFGRSLAACMLVWSCGRGGAPQSPAPTPEPHAAVSPSPADDLLAPQAYAGEPEAPRRARARMLERQIAARGIHDPRVLAAMAAVPRHRFVPEDLRDEAYADHPLPIGEGATISQPYIVALMTELAQVEPGDRALDVGTGSGYQAAVLAALGAQVYGVEIVASLADAARDRLAELGYEVEVRHGDGWAGWPERAPFDVIIVAAAPPRVPPALIEQLAEGGRLVIPVGRADQELQVLTKRGGSISRRTEIPVRFVPMTGRAQGAR